MLGRTADLFLAAAMFLGVCLIAATAAQGSDSAAMGTYAWLRASSGRPISLWISPMPIPFFSSTPRSIPFPGA